MAFNGNGWHSGDTNINWNPEPSDVTWTVMVQSWFLNLYKCIHVNILYCIHNYTYIYILYILYILIYCTCKLSSCIWFSLPSTYPHRSFVSFQILGYGVKIGSKSSAAQVWSLDHVFSQALTTVKLITSGLSDAAATGVARRLGAKWWKLGEYPPGNGELLAEWMERLSLIMFVVM